MIKIILDTQSAISGLLDFGAPREIILLTYKKHIQLWGSTLTFNEFCRVVRYPRLEKRVLARYLSVYSLEHEYSRLINFCITNNVEPGVIVPADRDDEEFIRVAIAINSKIIISRDNHLLDLSSYGSVRILRPSQFMEFWRNIIKVTSEGKRYRRTWRVWGIKK